MSRLLQRLEEDARRSTDRVSWARLVCRAASHHARQGNTAAATGIIEEVRRTFGTDFDAEAAVWLMLAEGILHFAEGNNVAALDRIRRADGLAVAMDVSSARASCAAWLAHIEFNLGNFSAMTSLLARTFREAIPEDHQALGRASLVIADAYHYSGSFARARPWYDDARRHATSEGDEAMLSATLHNVAAFRAVNVLLANALGDCLPEEAHRAKMEAASAASYDSAIGTRSFDSLTSLLSGQLMIVEGKVQEAYNHLSAVSTSAIPRRLWPVLHADLAWCSKTLGNHEKAADYCRLALEEAESPVDDDDAAYAWSRLASLHRELGDDSSSREMASRASDAMERLAALRTDLRRSLDACAASLPLGYQKKGPG